MARGVGEYQRQARTTPYTEAELLDMFKNGDPVSTIIMRAKRMNDWDRGRVREILFGKKF